MSFNAHLHTHRRSIQPDDLAVVYLGIDNLTTITISADPKAIYQCKFGAFRHSDMLGKSWGSKITSNKGNSHIYLLHPTAELWTLALPHRTQILYMADISMIMLELDMRPGSIVVESGTGSGSFSHSIARAIAPTGHLHTFEYHEMRAETARKEFQDHGLGNFVTVEHRDVCENGFGLEDQADAVFLDLPSPWLAIEHAKRALKKNTLTRICTFSPCIEQVQKTCAVLREHGFKEIQTIETLKRPYEVSKFSHLTSIEEDIQAYKEKIDRRQQNQQKYLTLLSDFITEQKVDLAPNSALANLASLTGASTVASESSDRPENKRPLSPAASTTTDDGADQQRKKRARTQEETEEADNGDDAAGEEEDGAQIHIRPARDMRGHTSYLTFAVLYKE